MRCAICDAPLSDQEVRFNRDHQKWDPCTVCKDIIAETVNDGGDTELVILEEELGVELSEEDIPSSD